MIKKLRIKFIIISMVSVLLVMVATIGAINISNYSSVKNGVDNSLNLVIENGFNDELPPGEPGTHPQEIQREHYFLVAFDSSGVITQSNFKHIFIVDEIKGKEMATNIYNGSSLNGKIDNLFYKKANKDNLTYVAFVDAKERLDSFNNFLVSSLIVASISYVAIFLLIFFSSKMVFKVSNESYKKQKAFITNASHELKTPLTIISTDLELVEMDNGKSEWTSSIKDQVDRLTKMTNQLVTLSRLDEEDFSKYPFEDFSLSSLASDCVNDFVSSFKKQNITLNIDIQDNISIRGNKYLIEELFLIFMDNALKYTPNGKEAGVSIHLNKKNRAVVIFNNNIEQGSEIDTNLLFERFYRSPNAKKEGSGIGLSIAKEIINLHKANVKVEKEEEILKFIITF